ncbi:GSCOCG00008381001-RA-CDS [Cotesia congregata]|nr:GSCOCG00008381001-RA-CDS [Cotesia congregata]
MCESQIAFLLDDKLFLYSVLLVLHRCHIDHQLLLEIQE